MLCGARAFRRSISALAMASFPLAVWRNTWAALAVAGKGKVPEPLSARCGVLVFGVGIFHPAVGPSISSPTLCGFPLGVLL